MGLVIITMVSSALVLPYYKGVNLGHYGAVASLAVIYRLFFLLSRVISVRTLWLLSRGL